MKIYVTRHGQTDYNKDRLMQGRSDIPLNGTGTAQAQATKEKIGDVKFDAVYASPLIRAVQTASIISGYAQEDIIKDDRIIEADFGKYEKANYMKLPLPMKLYWMYPEVFSAPKTVESIKSMVKRTSEFLKELEEKDYENVLVVCHGGIIRPIRGYLEDAKRGFIWRPRPANCEVFVYESKDGKHRLVEDIK
ncbi:histidine phosphatase family protein [Butyrivibrio sp. X503]|uniref:histidine phosphatase family protein n=1 Tax=Butyrivibrio sp. X503 TaxID=2364878 RepID=UPI000EA90EA0|nr:histidine phosphatase family protein [Butyrivibrio sp. X503]RKM56462.1 histidine phosphatase family protein [Butyrivibrio sp. X503]